MALHEVRLSTDEEAHMKIALWESRREEGTNIDVMSMLSGHLLTTVCVPWFEGDDHPLQIHDLKLQIAEATGIPVEQQRLFAPDGAEHFGPIHKITSGNECAVGLVRRSAGDDLAMVANAPSMRKEGDDLDLVAMVAKGSY